MEAFMSSLVQQLAISGSDAVLNESRMVEVELTQKKDTCERGS